MHGEFEVLSFFFQFISEFFFHDFGVPLAFDDGLGDSDGELFQIPEEVALVVIKFMTVVFHYQDKFIDTVNLGPEFGESDLVFCDGTLQID